jgi:drug/metabolite transporter (DMT)-like permease
VVNLLPIYYLGIFLCAALGCFSNQKYARSGNKLNSVHIYSLVSGLIAMTFFYVTSGFNINLNLRTTVYSIIFALLIFGNYFFTLIVFRFMGIAEKTFITSGLSLISTIILGIVLFEETFKPLSAVQLALVFATLLVIFLPNRRKQETSKSVTHIGVILCIGITILGVGCTLVAKYFAKDLNAGTVTDDKSFFFLTNAFIVAFGICTVMITQKFSLKSVIKEFKSVSLFNYFMIVLNVVSSNMGSVLQLLIFKEGDLVLYAPLSSALGLLAGEVVAVAFAKEKPRILATIFALSSVLVVLFF